MFYTIQSMADARQSKAGWGGDGTSSRGASKRRPAGEASPVLEKSIGLLQVRYGPRVIQPASTLSHRSAPPHVSTGFVQLDALTGCGGVPLGAITLFTGRTTSGKLTVAYKVLANAQRTSGRLAGEHRSREAPLRGVAILDLTYTANPDYLARCGVDLEHLLFARAPAPDQVMDVIFDLARGGLRLLLVDGLPDLLRDVAVARRFDAVLPELKMMLASLPCAVLFVDEARPPWLRWLRPESGGIAHCAALQVDLQREQWLEHGRDLIGYRAQAQVVRSRWARGGQMVPLEIVFDDTVRARETW